MAGELGEENEFPLNTILYASNVLLCESITSKVWLVEFKPQLSQLLDFNLEQIFDTFQAYLLIREMCNLAWCCLAQNQLSINVNYSWKQLKHPSTVEWINKCGRSIWLIITVIKMKHWHMLQHELWKYDTERSQAQRSHIVLFYIY